MTNKKEIRVFISSTFSDMNFEREVLIKKSFPALRALCASKGYSFMEIDLRWGITEKEASQGKVIPICLQEIDHCRPFFVGIIGDRYGSTRDVFRAAVLEQFPWLAGYEGRSITEFEILYGALNEHGIDNQALFYFRNPAFYEQLPEGTDTSIFFERSDSGKKELQRLKKELQQSKFPVKAYDNPEGLGKLIYQDLERALEKVFEEDEQQDSLDSHSIFAGNKCKLFYGRREALIKIDQFAHSAKNTLIIRGEKGAGKTALLAQWWLSNNNKVRKFDLDDSRKKSSFFSKLFKKNKANIPQFVLSHFVGADKRSSSWQEVIRRLIEKSNEVLNNNFPLPDTPSAFRVALRQWMFNLSSFDHRLIIIIDGIDQLEDEDQALDLTWLPTKIPANIKLIISASEGQFLDNLLKRKWETYPINTLAKENRKLLISEELRLYGKSLEPQQVATIIQNDNAGNPLFLKAIIEELRIFGSHKRLDLYLKDYSASADTKELYFKILKRLEKDFEDKHPGLVGKTMRIIWTSRHGILEKELLDLLGEHNTPFPMMHWSPIHLAIRPHIISRDGLLDFSNQPFRSAVETLYLDHEASKVETHQLIAQYFQNQSISQQKIDELPWHLAAIQDWEGLSKLLSNPQFFSAAWINHKYEIRAYWVKIFGMSSITLTEAYAPILSNAEAYPHCIWEICSLFDDLGQLHHLENVLHNLIAQTSRDGDELKLQAAYGMLGQLAFENRDYQEALDYFLKQEATAKQIDHKSAYASSLSNQAAIYRIHENYDLAEELYNKAQKLYKTQEDTYGLISCLSNLGAIDLDQGHHGKALEKYSTQYELSESLSDYEGMVRSLGAQALLLSKQNKFKKALNLIEAGENLSAQIGEQYYLFELLTWKANVLQEMADYDQANIVLEDQEALGKQLNDPKLMAINLSQQAQFYAFKINQPAFALSYAQQALELARSKDCWELYPKIQKQLAVIETLAETH